MNDAVRVRYAPSPTGYPHVGNIRAALFNWIFARRHGGSFLVRIEDTDRTRYVEGVVEAILEGLRWLGMDWDEGPEKGGDFGPYFQSQRLSKYKAAAERLIENGYAYRCYCSSERLEELRTAQTAAKQPTGYDRHCRDKCDVAPEDVKSVVRFKVPLEGRTTFTDLIRGDVTFENSLLDDFVLLKSDGFPTYHLANIVDDHDMCISHVIRGEEWLSSAPRHLMLYRALGYEPPEYAHLPMILGTDRSKLSKRHGAVSIIDYKV
ncbi:MAG: glutamate--tRNA ligase, partial [Dehalococcoidia bacterium]